MVWDVFYILFLLTIRFVVCLVFCCISEKVCINRTWGVDGRGGVYIIQVYRGGVFIHNRLVCFNQTPSISRDTVRHSTSPFSQPSLLSALQTVQHRSVVQQFSMPEKERRLAWSENMKRPKLISRAVKIEKLAFELFAFTERLDRGKLVQPHWKIKDIQKSHHTFDDHKY